MKNSVKALIIALALLSSNGVLSSIATARPTDDNETKKVATTTYQVAIFPAASVNVLNVIVEKAASKPLVVRMLNEKGDELSKQFLGKKAGNYQIKFNLEQLADGQYKVEVGEGKAKTSHPFTLATKTPVVETRTISLR